MGTVPRTPHGARTWERFITPDRWDIDEQARPHIKHYGPPPPFADRTWWRSHYLASDPDYDPNAPIAAPARVNDVSSPQKRPLTDVGRQVDSASRTRQLGQDDPGTVWQRERGASPISANEQRNMRDRLRRLRKRHEREAMGETLPGPRGRGA